MDVSELATAIEAGTDPRQRLERLGEQQKDFESAAEATRQAVLDTARAHRRLASLQLLGEADPDDVARARRDAEEAKDRELAHTAALEELQRRRVAAEQDVVAADREAALAARPVAAELAQAQLEKVQHLADKFAQALHEWGDLHAAAVGSRIGGLNQQNAHGCVEILEEYGFHFYERGFTFGSNGRPPTPKAILDLAGDHK